MGTSHRTLIVLGSLIAAMTLVSGVLLLLHPAPIPPLTHIHLLSTDETVNPADLLFTTAEPVKANRWRQIVISFSGRSYGSIATISQQHEQLNMGGVGHHFVIGNGSGSGDGQIDMGYRWRAQQPSAAPPYAPARDPRRAAGTIDICLVGDGAHEPPTEAQLRELVWLVRQLQSRLEIPGDQVILIDQGPHRAGASFPRALLSQQIFQRR